MATPPARTAGQRPLVALLATAVLTAGGVQLVQQQATDGTSGTDRSVAVPEAAPEPGRTAEVVGPVRGVTVSNYIADRTAALEEAPDTVDTAVVSLTERLRLDDALLLVGGVDVRGVLVRLPLTTETAVVVRVEAGTDPMDAVAAVLAQRAVPLRSELDELEELLDSGTVDDEAFVREYEQRAVELEEAIAAAEDTAAVVHGLVVRAPVEELRALQGQTGIRLVDPAPPGTDAATSVFTALLPRDTETVSEGRSA